MQLGYLYYQTEWKVLLFSDTKINGPSSSSEDQTRKKEADAIECRWSKERECHNYVGAAGTEGLDLPSTWSERYSRRSKVRNEMVILRLWRAYPGRNLNYFGEVACAESWRGRYTHSDWWCFHHRRRVAACAVLAVTPKLCVYTPTVSMGRPEQVGTLYSRAYRWPRIGHEPEGGVK